MIIYIHIYTSFTFENIFTLKENSSFANLLMVIDLLWQERCD